MAHPPTHKDDDKKPAQVATPEDDNDKSKVLLKPGAGGSDRVGGGASTVQAAKPKDSTADQSKMLCLLTADWLNGDMTHSAEIAKLLAAITATTAPPVNVDVPHATQAGAVLNCTMGNWTGEPTEYAYAWHADGVANGGTTATYTVVPEDSGKSLACQVTATNAMGSTAAPMSNAVAVA